MKKERKAKNPVPGKIITRKEAIKKAGYIGLSAATMMMLLSKSEHANAQLPSSPAPPPPW